MDSQSALLKRKEKRLVWIILVFFAFGIAISMGAWMFYLSSTMTRTGGIIEDPNETIESIHNTIRTFQILSVIGYSFVLTAIILTFWWAYLRYKQIAPSY